MNTARSPSRSASSADGVEDDVRVRDGLGEVGRAVVDHQVAAAGLHPVSTRSCRPVRPTGSVPGVGRSVPVSTERLRAAEGGLRDGPHGVRDGQVEADADVPFVDGGQVLTAAGAPIRVRIEHTRRLLEVTDRPRAGSPAAHAEARLTAMGGRRGGS